jgi:hypothetical protein
VYHGAGLQRQHLLDADIYPQAERIEESGLIQQFTQSIEVVGYTAICV